MGTHLTLVCDTRRFFRSKIPGEPISFDFASLLVDCGRSLLSIGEMLLLSIGSMFVWLNGDFGSASQCETQIFARPMFS